MLCGNGKKQLPERLITEKTAVDGLWTRHRERRLLMHRRKRRDRARFRRVIKEEGERSSPTPLQFSFKEGVGKGRVTG